MPEERILVLSIDRDDDIGEKAGIGGPIIGRKAVLSTIEKFGLADPEDTDLNNLFETLRVYDELSGRHKTEVAVLTGCRPTGFKSDKKISAQLEAVLKKFNATGAVIITDGSEDEHVIPVIQSAVPILSVKRIVVKQSEQLESTYYKIKDFINESAENPQMARMIFGLPAMVLLLLGIFGMEGLRVVIALLGVYLIIKGFRLESTVGNGINEMRNSFTNHRFSFFMYILALALGCLAAYRGYNHLYEWLNMGAFEAAAAFISGSVYLFWLAFSAAWIGNHLTGRSKKKRSKIAAFPVFGLALSVIIYSSSQLILTPAISMVTLVVSVAVGFTLLAAALLLEWKA